MKAAQAEYARLAQTLARPGWISEGYAQDRGAGAGGPCYQWTRKVRNKTLSVALSKEQYEWWHAAIQNWRRIQATLKERQRWSRRVLFETVKNPPRRKRLGKKIRPYLTAIPVRDEWKLRVDNLVLESLTARFHSPQHRSGQSMAIAASSGIL